MKKITAILVLFVSMLLYAADTDFPDFPKINGWRLKVSKNVYTPDNLWNCINGGADLYIKYGFTELHLADYTSRKKCNVRAEIYRHNSGVNAYGIYSAEKSPDNQFIELGAEAYLGNGILNIISGDYYLKLFTNGDGENGSAALKEIGRNIVAALGQIDELPKLLSVFPEKGKIDHSDRFIPVQYNGHDFLKNVYRRDYEEGYSLFIMEGEDNNEILNAVTSYLEVTHQDIDSAANSNITIEDPYLGNIPVIIEDKYLIGILNNTGSEHANTGLQSLSKTLQLQGR